MDFKQAIGVCRCDIDVATGKQLTHEEIYDRMIEYLGGLDVVFQFVPFSISEITTALKGDEHLNNLAYNRWSFAAGFNTHINHVSTYRCRQPVVCWKPTYGCLWNLYRIHGITSASCAEGVCLLKRAAVRMAERSNLKMETS